MSYYKVAKTAEIPQNQPGQAGLRVRLGRDDIGLFRYNGQIHAINDLCPHRGAPLSEGFIDQGKVFCPWHCFDFHLETGESTIASHLCVTTYPVRIDGDAVSILYPDELATPEDESELIGIDEGDD